MKPIVKNISVALAVAIVMLFVGYELGLAVSGQAMPALIFFCAVLGVIIYWLWLEKNKKGGMFAALDWALAQWEKENEELTTREDWAGTKGYACQTLYYAFVRKRTLNYKSGRKAIMIVEVLSKGYDMAAIRDNPSTDEMDDPWKALPINMRITPVPTKEPYFKYYDMFPPHMRKRGRGGVTVNTGPMGATGPPKDSTGDGEEQ